MSKYTNLRLPAWPDNTLDHLDASLAAEVKRHAIPIGNAFQTDESLQEYRAMLADFANSYAQDQITDASIRRQMVSLPRKAFPLGDLGDGNLDVAVWDIPDADKSQDTKPRALIFISPGCCTQAQPALCEEFVQSMAREVGASKAFSPAHRGVPDFSLMAHVHASFQEVVVVGSSSGGEMALFSEILHNKLTGKSSNVVVMMHSAGMLEPDMDSFTDARVPPLYASLATLGSLRGVIGRTMDKSRELSSSLQSPVAYSQLATEDLRRIKALVSLGAEFDHLRDGATKLAETMQALGVPASHHVVAKAAHCSTETFPNLEISRAARQWLVQQTLVG